MSTYLSPKEVAKILNVSVRTVERLIKSGRLPAVDLFPHEKGRRRKGLWRIPASALEAFKREAFQGAGN